MNHPELSYIKQSQQLFTDFKFSRGVDVVVTHRRGEVTTPRRRSSPSPEETLREGGRVPTQSLETHPPAFTASAGGFICFWGLLVFS